VYLYNLIEKFINMRHFTSFVAIAVMALFFTSCNEDTVSSVSAPVKTKHNSLLPGEIHNSIVDKYIAAYGLEHDPAFTKDEFLETASQIAEIGLENGYFGETITKAELVAAAGAILDEYGLVTVDFAHKRISDVAPILIGAIQNAEMKEAFSNVHNLMMSEEDSAVSQSLQILYSLNSLTEHEQNMVDGFASVLGSSYGLWQEKDPLLEPMASKAMIAYWDATGYMMGYNWGLAHDFIHCLVYAEDMSATMSSAYARNF
jgi:hypothetical protein